tara:strand:+ start:163 stop:294 length:132 start_codon:yes stop_codon:yes gene_type:complete
MDLKIDLKKSFYEIQKNFHEKIPNIFNTSFKATMILGKYFILT